MDRRFFSPANGICYARRIWATTDPRKAAVLLASGTQAEPTTISAQLCRQQSDRELGDEDWQRAGQVCSKAKQARVKRFQGVSLQRTVCTHSELFVSADVACRSLPRELAQERSHIAETQRSLRMHHRFVREALTLSKMLRVLSTTFGVMSGFFDRMEAGSPSDIVARIGNRTLGALGEEGTELAASAKQALATATTGLTTASNLVRTAMDTWQTVKPKEGEAVTDHLTRILETSSSFLPSLPSLSSLWGTVRI